MGSSGRTVRDTAPCSFPEKKPKQLWSWLGAPSCRPPPLSLATQTCMQRKQDSKDRDREREAHQNQNRSKPTTTGKTTTTNKNKGKTGAGVDLDEVENEGIRVEGDGRVQDEGTQGEPQTATQSVCPQHLKRRKEKREDGEQKPTNNKRKKQKKRERERDPATIFTRVGS